MKKLQKVLMPIDFSNAAQNAVLQASNILKDQAAEVIFVYTATSDKEFTEHDIQSTFNKFKGKALTDAPFLYQLEIRHGDTLKELARACHSHEADLVIMGLKERISDAALASAMIRLRKDSLKLQKA